MLAVILAAGKGTRLGALTADHSKAMLPIVGKPMIERVMAQIASAGVDEFLLVVSPDDSEIVPHFKHRTKIFKNLRFATQDQPLGMGQALLSAADFIHDSFLVAACDNLVATTHIREMLHRWGTETALKAILSLMPVEPQQVGNSGIVELDGDIVTRIVEKPQPDEVSSNIASLPLYIFTPDILDLLEDVRPSIRGEIELQDAIHLLIHLFGGVVGARTNRRLTLTTLDDYIYINLHYLRSGDFISRSFSHLSGSDFIVNPPYYIGSDVKIGEDSVIGPNVFLNNGSELSPRTKISNAVVLGKEIYRYI